MLARISNSLKKLAGFGQSEAFEIMESDIFLVSYPRSGSTWMRYLLAHLFYPEHDWDITSISLVIPDIHQKIPQNGMPMNPRIIKSHETYTPLYGKVIYLYRDGRDVAVSYYDFMKKLNNYQGSFAQFLDDFISGDIPFGSWHQHVNSWLFNNREVDLLAINYSDLYRDSERELLRVKDFLQTAWGPDDISLSVERSSMEKFRKDYQKLKYESHWQKGFQGGVKGGPGKWKEVFSLEQNDLFWSVAGETMDKLGFQKEQ